MSRQLDVVVLGLSITSSWGNGHATNYRALLRELHQRGHRVLFLERDVPWYATHRDLPDPSYCRTRLYASVEELRERFREAVRRADVVMVGSYVPDGVEVGRWVQEEAHGVTAFYDIDTPVTLEKLEAGDHQYLAPELVPGYDLYLSFTSGPTLSVLEDRWGSPDARPFHCLVDPERYHPLDEPERWLLGYMGTYSQDRQPTVESHLLAQARGRMDDAFVVAGPGYPDSVAWPPNVQRVEHLPPDAHPSFYNAQRFTLNATRRAMAEAGWAPGVRLFEAAACGVPVVSDRWRGIEEFFEPGTEILLADSGAEVAHLLDTVSPERAREIGDAARRRVLAEHTPDRRADQLERYVGEVRRRTSWPAAPLDPSARLRDEVERRGPWFHNLHLPGGVQTAPDHFLGDFPTFKWRELAPTLPGDLTDWSVLDIGCNAGFYSFELARRGASVLGIDHDERYLAQARWAGNVLGLASRVRFARRSVYDLARSREQWDLVLFMGVLYHLRYPLLALDAVAHVARRLAVVQSLTMPGDEVLDDTSGRGLGQRDDLLHPGWPKMAFLEHGLEGDPTNWWAPSHACVEAMLRSAGLAVLERPGHEMYLCEPESRLRGYGASEQLREAAGTLEEPTRRAQSPVSDALRSRAPAVRT
jgi:methyltransferase (TIGR04290 family)